MSASATRAKHLTLVSPHPHPSCPSASARSAVLPGGDATPASLAHQEVLQSIEADMKRRPNLTKRSSL